MEKKHGPPQNKSFHKGKIQTWPWRKKAFALSSPSRMAKSVSNNAPLISPSFSLQA